MATAPSGSPSGDLLVPAGPPVAARPRRALIPQFGGIWGFVIRRILLGLLVLFIVSIVVFAATQALGDPARAILGRQATPDSLKALRDQLNLDRSVFSQYWSWLTGLLHGDAGVSYAAQIPVSDLIDERIVNSAFLVFCSAIISLPLAIAIGAYAALRRDKLFDSASSLITLLFAAMPEFVIGLWLVVIFATTVFPGTLPSITQIPPGGRPWDDMTAMILPTATLVLTVTPYVARVHDRRARVRLRRDGSAQGPARAHGADPARAAERGRPRLPGDRDQPRLPRGRRDRGRVHLQLPRY